MRRVHNLLIFGFCWLTTVSAIAVTSSAEDFHSKVLAIYSFEPHKLKEGEMKAKSEQLDQFWSQAKTDVSNTLPHLRKELVNPSNSAFFFYDGSKLLLSLSKDKSDEALALRSIPKADLKGVQHTDYLRTIKGFADKGLDTREAAFRVLAYPDFKAFIPQHALTLGQDYSLIYMLFPLSESTFVADLDKRLSTETNSQSLKSLLLALWYTATPAGNTAIQNFVNSKNDQVEAKTYAKSLLARKVGALSGISFSSTQTLREERRKVMQRPISDEALIEFDSLTVKIMGKN